MEFRRWLEKGSMKVKQLKRPEKQDQKSLAVWAADCAERVLPHFEKKHPRDKRPRKAIEAARAWARGEIRCGAARAAALAAHAAARAADDPAARAAARAAGHAAATAHVPSHAPHAAAYAAKAAATAAQVKYNPQTDLLSRLKAAFAKSGGLSGEPTGAGRSLIRALSRRPR
jgi:hypothetical protein